MKPAKNWITDFIPSLSENKFKILILTLLLFGTIPDGKGQTKYQPSPENMKSRNGFRMQVWTLHSLGCV